MVSKEYEIEEVKGCTPVTRAENMDALVLLNQSSVQLYSPVYASARMSRDLVKICSHSGVIRRDDR